MSKTAITAAPILPVIAERWSPRSYDASYTATQHELLSILEAGRWAPSANNLQPWRYSLLAKGTDLHAKVLATFSGFNQVWAANASHILIVSIVTKTADGAEHAIAKFDAGLSVQNMLLQAQELGLAAHPTSGYDHGAVNAILQFPTDVESLVAVVLGKLASPDLLEGPLKERELGTRVRKDLDDIVLHGKP